LDEVPEDVVVEVDGVAAAAEAMLSRVPVLGLDRRGGSVSNSDDDDPEFVSVPSRPVGGVGGVASGSSSGGGSGGLGLVAGVPVQEDDHPDAEDVDDEALEELAAEAVLCLSYTYLRHVVTCARTLGADAVAAVAQRCLGPGGAADPPSPSPFSLGSPAATVAPPPQVFPGDGGGAPMLQALTDRLVCHWATTQLASVCCCVVDLLAALSLSAAAAARLGHLAMGGLHTVFPYSVLQGAPQHLWRLPVVVPGPAAAGAVVAPVHHVLVSSGLPAAATLAGLGRGPPAQGALLPTQCWGADGNAGSSSGAGGAGRAGDAGPAGNPLPEEVGGLPEDDDAAATLAAATHSLPGADNAGSALRGLAAPEFAEVRYQLVTAFVCLPPYQFECAAVAVLSNIARTVRLSVARGGGVAGEAAGDGAAGSGPRKRRMLARSTHDDDFDGGVGGRGGAANRSDDDADDDNDDDDDWVRGGAAAPVAAVVPVSMKLASLSSDSVLWYCEAVLVVLVVHLARTPPGVLLSDAPGGAASSAHDLMSVDELLGVKVGGVLCCTLLYRAVLCYTSRVGQDRGCVGKGMDAMSGGGGRTSPSCGSCARPPSLASCEVLHAPPFPPLPAPPPSRTCAQIPIANLHGGAAPESRLSDSERVCVGVRRAISLLRLHLSVAAALLEHAHGGRQPPTSV
jgi:hypothetical protein